MGIEASRMQPIVDRRVSRRAFLIGSGVLFSSALGSCGLLGPQGRPGNRRLTARPGQAFLQPDLGESMLGLGSDRDGLIFDLRDKGYSVDYREFIGGHSVPDDIADAAMDWFLD